MMAMFFAQRVILGKTTFANVPKALKAGVAEVLIDSGLPELVPTEYGGVNLVGCSTWERAERLISVAHPKFRDELVEHARQQGIWIRSNKR